jgi:hypothetical protein
MKLGHTLVSPVAAGKTGCPTAQHLYLRIGFGDITILKEPTPSIK